MLKLVLDSGNTSLKAAFWKNKTLLAAIRNTTFSYLFSKEIKAKYGEPEAILFSSVSTKKELPLRFSKQNFFLHTLNSKTKLPIRVRYKTPLTLGNDRLANAAGAHGLFPGCAVLVIDAGTCLKFDFVDAKGNYLGGSISPGLQMRYDALHHYTAKLPQLKFTKRFPLTGTSTLESITSGVQNGILAETEGLISAYMNEYKSLQLILTGGDYRFFAGNLKKHIFVSPNLTLFGLNEILDYNRP